MIRLPIVKIPGGKDPALGCPLGGDFDPLSPIGKSAEVTKNSKSQITNTKQITMTKIPNSKPVFCFGH
jgi:hypothetical protein